MAALLKGSFMGRSWWLLPSRVDRFHCDISAICYPPLRPVVRPPSLAAGRVRQTGGGCGQLGHEHRRLGSGLVDEEAFVPPAGACPNASAGRKGVGRGKPGAPTLIVPWSTRVNVAFEGSTSTPNSAGLVAVVGHDRRRRVHAKRRHGATGAHDPGPFRRRSAGRGRACRPRL